ncbi:MAG: glucose 1-dehydrogenase [Candidatus Bathyarchaeota archaeon]|nr:glucose 1-dehydrogenase [Candidatus Bathyarchaeota archaeon]
MNRMKGKVAIVTGAALGYKSGGSSIGSAIAIKLASEGAKVVVVDINEKMGQRTADTIINEGNDALFIPCDVEKSDEVQHVLKASQQTFSTVNCLINCAASYQGNIFQNIVNTTETDWKHIIDVNLNGYYRFAKYTIPVMLEQGGGSIVNISSMAAFTVVKNFSVYPVTKAAINALTRTIAIDFAPTIRCNAICPGFVRIANSEGDRTPIEVEKWIEGISATYPLERVCSVDEIANVALFLASDESSYITGECIIMDGGRSISDCHLF